MRSSSLWPFLTLGTLMMLTGSVLVNRALYHRAKSYYVQLNQVRLDPLGLSHYTDAQLDVSPHQEELRVVFLGDSRAEGWPEPEIAGYEFINRGIGSQTSAQVLQRFEHHVTPLQPDVIILQVGINDLKTIGLFPAQRDAIAAQTQENIAAIVVASKQLGAMVILTTLFPVGEIPLPRQPFWSSETEAAILEVNGFIHSLEDEQVIVFDAFEVLRDRPDRIKPEFSKDELHLNAQGYVKLNQELKRYLLKL